MRLNIHKFALSAALTMSAVYLACLALSALAPVFTIKLFGWLVHLINLEQFMVENVEVTFFSFTVGLAQTFAYAYLVTLFFGWLYNKLTARG